MKRHTVSSQKPERKKWKGLTWGIDRRFVLEKLLYVEASVACRESSACVRP